MNDLSERERKRESSVILYPNASGIPMVIECYETQGAQARFTIRSERERNYPNRPTLSLCASVQVNEHGRCSRYERRVSRHTFAENNGGRQNESATLLARTEIRKHQRASRRNLFLALPRRSLSSHRAPPCRRPSSFLRECLRDGRGLRLLFAPPETLSRACPFFPDASLLTLLDQPSRALVVSHSPTTGELNI